MLLHGAPGVGKSRTIVGMIFQLLLSKSSKKPDERKKILVCTPSNTAIDELMRRIEEAIPDIPSKLLIVKRSYSSEDVTSNSSLKINGSLLQMERM
jgi:superfamily I DNA and/or RNA helicase